MQEISHSQSIGVGLLFMGLSNIRALRLVLIYFHIPKKTTFHVSQLLFCTLRFSVMAS